MNSVPPCYNDQLRFLTAQQHFDHSNDRSSQPSTPLGVGPSGISVHVDNSGPSAQTSRTAPLPAARTRKALPRTLRTQASTSSSWLSTLTMNRLRNQVIEAKTKHIPLHVVLHELQNKMYPFPLEESDSESDDDVNAKDSPPIPGEYEILCIEAERWYYSDLEPALTERHVQEENVTAEDDRADWSWMRWIRSWLEY